MRLRLAGAAAAAALVTMIVGAWAIGARAQQPPPPAMSFFVTSVGLGNGGNLGGLDGADKHCQQLAAAVGAGNRTWRAYLSTGAAGPQPAINARDRIGRGPWYNAKGVLIASNVDDLHEDRNNIRKPTALSEKGGEVQGVGDQPNEHDILTGSDSSGRAVVGSPMVTTCNNWVSNDNAHRAIVGHHDRLGGPNASWNAVHSSGGCSQEALVKTGGAGLFYCFAAD
jgi:hypothetical protein